MIFKQILQIWASRTPRKRVVFPWVNRVSGRLLSSFSEPSQNKLSALVEYLKKNKSSFKRFLHKSRTPALICTYALFVLWSPFIQVGAAHAPVLAAEDVQRMEEQIARQKEIAQLREDLRLFLERYNSELGPDYLDAVIAVEENFKMEGFSKLATAVALNESYLGKVYPKGSYNIWGLGASTPNRWIDYDSWEEGATDFYRVIRKLGLEKVTYPDLIKISRAYVGTSEWRQWGDKIWSFYLRI